MGSLRSLETSANGYIQLVFTGILGLVVPCLFLFIISGLKWRRVDSKSKVQSVNTRFYPATNVAIIFCALILMLAPLVEAFDSPASDIQAFRAAVIAIVTGGGFLFISLLYLIRRGDHRWLRSITPFRKPKE